MVGISGSLRKGSYNSALLREAKRAAPAHGAEIEIVSIADLPLYNTDIEQPLPDTVKVFKDKVKAADAILIASPEYNYSVSGVLKNAIDWLSRPPDDVSLKGKTVAIMGASPGTLGSGRAQYHLRQILLSITGIVLPRPEVIVTLAKDKFDEQGNLTDEKTREKVSALVNALVEWVERSQA
ncbi:MAG: NAD(P)H-dependent oxidoreductase [Candidatus Uhrbacteria bacterium]|nr:NAD(P)H-dependent oxidoreductase [Candidatus Uhrbacteria bacterium]